MTTAGATTADGQPVVVVTGGGGGIGAAVAEELGRTGAFVVTLDPLVSVDGAEQLAPEEETTAGRIVASGGSARASSASVADADAVAGVFEELMAERGRLDAVVNVAGITRPTSFATGSEPDWLDVLQVHLGGYLNVLRGALPLMAAAGRGRVVGVTSGSGWRPANTGAYGCAKRAVASLTWQLGGNPPPGVVVNAMSPIAMTRMVTAALERASRGRAPGAGTAASGGLSLGSMPAPGEIGPLGAHLAGEEFAWCSGQVIFAGGSEVAVVEQPRLLEVVRSDDATSLAHLLDAVVPGAWVPAEASQVSTGGSNPRFGGVFDAPPTGDRPAAAVRSCAIASDRPDLARAVAGALEVRGIGSTVIAPDPVTVGFGGAAGALASAVERGGPIDAVVVALAEPLTSRSGAPWEQALAEHEGLVARIVDDAGWARAVADHAAGTGRAVRLVTLSDATTAGGRSRAQAAAQHARAARGATDDRVVAFAVGVEASGEATARAVAELTAHLLADPAATSLAGAELVAGAGWLGVRSHPRPAGTVVYGGPAVPGWLDDTLRGVIGAPAPSGDVAAALTEVAP